MTLLLYKVWLSINDNAVNSTEMAFHTNQRPLLTNRKKTALQNLRSNDDIIIKPADKDSAAVVMDKSAYIRETERPLSDDRFYNKPDKDPTKQFSNEITNELNNMYDYGYIDEKLSNT